MSHMSDLREYAIAAYFRIFRDYMVRIFWKNVRVFVTCLINNSSWDCTAQKANNNNHNHHHVRPPFWFRSPFSPSPMTQFAPTQNVTEYQ